MFENLKAILNNVLATFSVSAEEYVLGTEAY